MKIATDLDAGADMAVEAQRPIHLYVEDQGRAYVFFPSRAWRQLQGAPALRCTPVQHLVPTEARQLLSHSHKLSPERRKALMLVSAENPSAYFNESEQEEIKAWIAQEPSIEEVVE